MELITLGELISKLSECKEDTEVQFDFGYFTPNSFGSWRGSYDQLALSYCDFSITVEQLLQKAEKAVGATYTGWKGGDFHMNASNIIWVSQDGNSNMTVITGLTDLGHKVVLHTAYREW